MAAKVARCFPRETPQSPLLHMHPYAYPSIISHAIYIYTVHTCIYIQIFWNSTDIYVGTVLSRP